VVIHENKEYYYLLANSYVAQQSNVFRATALATARHHYQYQSSGSGGRRLSTESTAVPEMEQ